MLSASMCACILRFLAKRGPWGPLFGGGSRWHGGGVVSMSMTTGKVLVVIVNSLPLPPDPLVALQLRYLACTGYSDERGGIGCYISHARIFTCIYIYIGVRYLILLVAIFRECTSKQAVRLFFRDGEITFCARARGRRELLYPEYYVSRSIIESSVCMSFFRASSRWLIF